MNLDPLTFALEILNFLVLIWLLQRFLYKPIKAAVAQRQATLEQGLKDAQLREQSAAALEREYQRKIDDWQVEQNRQQQELQNQLARERESALTKIRDAANAEKARLQLLQEQDQAALDQHIREQATAAALQLTGRMLQRLAGEALDQALVNLLLDEILQLPEPDKDGLRSALTRQKSHVTVVSARPLAESVVAQIRQALSQLASAEVQIATTTDPALISGLRVTVGARILHANLADELAFFRAGLNHGNG